MIYCSPQPSTMCAYVVLLLIWPLNYVRLSDSLWIAGVPDIKTMVMNTELIANSVSASSISKVSLR